MSKYKTVYDLIKSAHEDMKQKQLESANKKLNKAVEAIENGAELNTVVHEG